MAKYALIDIATNSIREYRDFTSTPPDVVRKGIRWLPVVITDPPVTETQIKSEPVITVEPTRVTWVRTVRDKTPAELDAEKESYLDGIEKLGFQVDFDHENRIRLLEGKAEITAAQFRAVLKARL